MNSNIRLLLLAALMCVENLIAQETPQWREMFVKEAPEHADLIDQIHIRADSALMSTDGSHRRWLDSLWRDSLTNTLNSIGLSLRLNLFDLEQRMNRPKMALPYLLEAQQLALHSGNNNALMMAVHRYISEELQALKLFPEALNSAQALTQMQYELQHAEVVALESENAAQQAELTALKSKSDKLERESEKLVQFTPIAIGVVALLLCLCLLFLGMWLKWKKRHGQIKQLLEERNIEMNETQKISVQYKNEGTQFKQTVEAAITKLNQMESAKVVAHRELAHWRDESTQELGQLKELVDQMKDIPSVANYMSIQNQVQRLQVKNKETLSKLAEQLRV